MEDLAAFAHNPETRRLFSERRSLWAELFRLHQSGAYLELAARLRTLVSDGLPISESIVRDFLEITSRYYPRPKAATDLSPQVLGLPNVVQDAALSPADAARIYPIWKSAILNPDAEFPKMIERREFTALGAMSDSLGDPIFHTSLARVLQNRRRHLSLRHLFSLLILRAKQQPTQRARGEYDREDAPNRTGAMLDLALSIPDTGHYIAIAKIMGVANLKMSKGGSPFCRRTIRINRCTDRK